MLTKEEIEELEAAQIVAQILMYGGTCFWIQKRIDVVWYGSRPLVDAVYDCVAASHWWVYVGGQIFSSKEEVVQAIKAFFIKSHQQYNVYKSSTTLNAAKVQTGVWVSVEYLAYKT